MNIFFTEMPLSDSKYQNIDKKVKIQNILPLNAFEEIHLYRFTY